MIDDQEGFDPDDRGIRDPEAAKILGLQQSTLPNWRARGRGPKFRKVGRNVEYTPKFLREYRESCERTPEPAAVRRQRRALAGAVKGGNPTQK